MIAYPSTGVPIKLTSPLTKSNTVQQIQKRLINLGISCGPKGADSVYGTDTYNAVKIFQSGRKISATGIVNKKTWEALFEGVTTLSKSSDMLFGSIISDKPFSSFQDKISGFSTSNIPEDIDDSFSSYIINLASERWMPLPIIPEQISEQLSALWGETSVIGRSASFRSYQGTANRAINFSLKLHLDLLQEISIENNIDLTNIGDFLKSLVYPQYTSSLIKPPVCILKVADVVKLRGICLSVNPNYSLPIKDIVYGAYKNKKKYTVADISLSFVEVPVRAPSAKDIHDGKEFVYGRK